LTIKALVVVFFCTTKTGFCLKMVPNGK